MRCYLLEHPELHAEFRKGDRQVLRDVCDFHEPQLEDFFESGFITAKGLRVPPLMKPDDIADALGDLPSAVQFGTSPRDGGPISSVALARRHPDPLLDVGALLLAHDAPIEITPWPLATAAIGAQLAAGQRMRIVGMASHPGGVFKREGHARITQVERHWLRSAPDPETACRGDSGGPALLELDGQEVLVGIASLGAEECDGDIQHVRVDAIVEHFIHEFPEPSVAPESESIGEADAVRPLSAQAAAGCSAHQPRRSISSLPLAVLALPLLLLLRRPHLVRQLSLLLHRRVSGSEGPVLPAPPRRRHGAPSRCGRAQPRRLVPRRGSVERTGRTGPLGRPSPRGRSALSSIEYCE